jgi:Transposase DDE domain
MAEIGVIRFAQVAREVAETAVPRDRRRVSTHLFTPPGLLARRCLLRDEDWTSRATAVRLRDHAALREARQIGRVPDHTTL